LRYYRKQLGKHEVQLFLNRRITVEHLIYQQYDHVIIATGVKPKLPDIPGVNHPMVIGYQDLLEQEPVLGERVAIVGAGGIGFDVAEYLSTDLKDKSSINRDLFLQEWGIDPELKARGGIEGITPEHPKSPRDIYLIQRKTSRHGKGLGKTTGWIHRATHSAG
jgi:2,4-dienoyl-CoA reductase (NADPH2)